MNIIREKIFQNVYREKIFDQDSGFLKYSFFYDNGEPIRQFVIETTLGKRLAAYHLIEKDLNSALAGFKYLIDREDNNSLDVLSGLKDVENPEFIVTKSLLQAAIVTYGKCFANSSGNKKKSNVKSRGVKLERKLLESFSSKHQETHDLIMNLRNDYVAHGGVNELELSYTYVLVMPDSKLDKDIFVTETHVGGFEVVFYKDACDLISSIKEELEIMQNKKRTALFNKYLSELTDKDINDHSHLEVIVQLSASSLYSSKARSLKHN